MWPPLSALWPDHDNQFYLLYREYVQIYILVGINRNQARQSGINVVLTLLEQEEPQQGTI